MAKTIDELRTAAVQIRDEKGLAKNTAKRLGQALLDHADTMKAEITTLSNEGRNNHTQCVLEIKGTKVAEESKYINLDGQAVDTPLEYKNRYLGLIPVKKGEIYIYKGFYNISVDKFPVWGYTDVLMNGANHLPVKFTGEYQVSEFTIGDGVNYISIWGSIAKGNVEIIKKNSVNDYLDELKQKTEDNRNSLNVLTDQLSKQTEGLSTEIIENDTEYNRTKAEISYRAEIVGFLKPDGSISNGDYGNRRTGLIKVKVGDIIEYNGGYNIGEYRPICAYSSIKMENPKFIGNFTGSYMTERYIIEDKNIKYIIAWGSEKFGKVIVKITNSILQEQLSKNAEDIKKNSDDIKKNAQDIQNVIVPQKTIIKVGYGYDFNNIQEAINSVSDASVVKQYTIELYDDIYITDLKNLYKYSNPKEKSTDNPTEYVAAVITRPFVNIRGVGGERTIHIETPLSASGESLQYIQTVYLQGSCTIENLNVSIHGGRYAIHQESQGSKDSVDYHAHTICKDLKVVHYGNEGYNEGWKSTYAMAVGTNSGLTLDYIRCSFESKGLKKEPMYFHTHISPYDSPVHINYLECSMVVSKGTKLIDFKPHLSDIGSCQKNIVNIVGCNIIRFTVDNISGLSQIEKGLGDNFADGGAIVGGYSNAKMIAERISDSVIWLQTINKNSKIEVIGGSAKDLIFGREICNYNSTNDVGISVGEKRCQKYGGSNIFTLSYRLGNCRDVTKNLIVRVDGQEYDIVFNKNYMTQNGESYTPFTNPFINTQQILDDVNALYPTIFKIKYQGGNKRIQTMTENKVNIINATAESFNVGEGLIRDFSKGIDVYRKAKTGEKADVVCGIRIDANKNGYAIPVESCMFEKNTLNIAEAINDGIKIGIVEDGKFGRTDVNPTFVAVDPIFIISL